MIGRKDWEPHLLLLFVCLFQENKRMQKSDSGSGCFSGTQLTGILFLLKMKKNFFLWKKPRNLPQSLSTSLFNKIIIIKKNNHAIYLELHCCFSKINYAFYLLARRSLWRQRRGRRWLNWAHYPREPNAPTWQWTRTKKLSAMLFRCLEPSEYAIWVCGYFLASNQYNFWDS